MCLDRFIQAIHDKGDYMENLTELSRNSSGTALLPYQSQYSAYNYDRLTRELIYPHCDADTLPRSADALIIRGEHLIYIEFKLGFEDKVTKKSWKPHALSCMNTDCGHSITHQHAPCHTCDISCAKCGSVLFSVAGIRQLYRNLFFNKRKLEKEQLQDSFKLKLLETYTALEKEILPRFHPEITTSKLKLHFLAVTDRASDLHDNFLKKYRKQKKRENSFKSDYHFDFIEILSKSGLDDYLNEYMHG